MEEMSLSTASKPPLPLPCSCQRAVEFGEQPCPAADLETIFGWETGPVRLCLLLASLCYQAASDVGALPQL